MVNTIKHLIVSILGVARWSREFTSKLCMRSSRKTGISIRKLAKQFLRREEMKKD